VGFEYKAGFAAAYKRPYFLGVQLRGDDYSIEANVSHGAFILTVGHESYRLLARLALLACTGSASTRVAARRMVGWWKETGALLERYNSMIHVLAFYRALKTGPAKKLIHPRQPEWLSIQHRWTFLTPNAESVYRIRANNENSEE